MAIREDFPRILAALLEETGISKKRVAEAAGVGSSSVTHWLNGRNLPSLDRLDPIAELFGVDPTSLIRNGSGGERVRVERDDLALALRHLADVAGYKLVPKDD